jgi:hypothetical protein
MARKGNENKAELVKETKDILVFKANRRMGKGEFELLSELVRKEEEKSGVKIVLAPNSIDLESVDNEQQSHEHKPPDEKDKE